MIRMGTPLDIENYYIADGWIAEQLHAHGFIPLYKDYEALYFKKTNKLLQFVKNLGLFE